MSLFTTLTRMWLTKSFKPFIFKNEYDEKLPYEECESLGLYIHIPFCMSICNFCPYCKVLYSKELCDKYIDALIKEIHITGSSSGEKKQVTSLYFGGGTPVLAGNRLSEIIEIVNKYFIITEGIGIELHPENVTYETLSMLQKAGITKISIGIQSFNSKYQNMLGRKSVNIDELKTVLDKVQFETVSMDFIFALPNQSFEDLKDDVDKAFYAGANHIAIYPFIDFTFTKSSVKVMSKKEKRKLLDDITAYFTEKGYVRSSIWTFSNSKNANYSSMTRDNFLGFGCSATTLLKNKFKINTFDIKSYCSRINENKLPTSLTIRFTKRQRMIYWLFWTAYSTKVNADDFKKFFGVSLEKMYGFELWLAKVFGFIVKKENIYEMTLKGAFYYHYYENFYTLSYIDKMWGIMKDNPFPKEIKL